MQPDFLKAFETTAEKRVIESIPDMPDHVFSKQFERKMQQLIEHGEPVKRQPISARKIFVYITAAIIAAVLMVSAAGAARDFFKRFFMEVFDTHATVQSTDNSSEQMVITDIYTINAPDGFELTYQDEVKEMSTYLNYEFSCDDGKYIFFSQYTRSTYISYVNTEDYSIECIEINGNEGYIVDFKNGEYFLSWNNGEYVFELTGNVSKNELEPVDTKRKM